MIPKKNPNVDLEKRKSLFFEIGMVVALAVTFVSFEWKSNVKEAIHFTPESEFTIDEEMVPITRQEEIQAPPKLPPKIKITDVITIVDDDVELEEELEIIEEDINQETEVEIQPIREIVQEEEELDEAQIFVIVEEMPIFRPDICNNQKEGDAELYRYIYKNLKYPIVAQENGITGRVFVKFVVGKDGGIYDIEVLRGVDPSLDQEAIRVIQNLPKFAPGKQRGKPVKVSYTSVIKFVLQ
ncbi:energy transducer TonB [Marinifilum caeruleilacunae]|uniref:Energy transducer TonB n=1 Tax=Marinifilum caeruleilacunae TaxID=2499076 RepID=A0ABX1WZ38_9BACT|nr:energy transducer TonB [Marinifilum caeruleilacunae]NOU61423.1 energy transducer TonB [Marinifilum caeruleilacunae]